MYQRGQKRRRASNKGRAGKFLKRRKGAFAFSYGTGSKVSGVRPFKAGGSATMATMPTIIGVPGRMELQLRGTIGYTLTSTTGAFSTAVISRCNSIFDPFAASSAATLAMVNSWMGPTSASTSGLYHSYIVKAFKHDIVVSNLQSANYPMRFGIVARPNTQSVCTAWNQVTAQAHSIVRQIDPGGNGGRNQHLSMYRSVAAVYAESKACVALDDSFAALSDANPASEVDLDAYVQTQDGATTQTIYITHTITMWVTLFGPKRGLEN